MCPKAARSPSSGSKRQPSFQRKTGLKSSISGPLHDFYTAGLANRHLQPLGHLTVSKLLGILRISLGSTGRQTVPQPVRRLSRVSVARDIIAIEDATGHERAAAFRGFARGGELQRISIENTLRADNRDSCIAALKTLEASFAKKWGGQGRVAEAFGHAWMKLDRFDDAVTWYERARNADDGTAPLASVEQLVNALSRAAWNSIADLPNVTSVAIDSARQKIGEAVVLMKKLLTLESTSERESILAAAYKRLALVEMKVGNTREREKAVARMMTHYARTEPSPARRRQRAEARSQCSIQR